MGSRQAYRQFTSMVKDHTSDRNCCVFTVGQNLFKADKQRRRGELLALFHECAADWSNTLLANPLPTTVLPSIGEPRTRNGFAHRATESGMTIDVSVAVRPRNNASLLLNADEQQFDDFRASESRVKRRRLLVT